MCVCVWNWKQIQRDNVFVLAKSRNSPLKLILFFFYSRRRALHQYDPKDLMSSFSAEAHPTPPPSTAVVDDSVQGRQIAEAKRKGLLVDVSKPAESSWPTSIVAPDRVMRSDAILNEVDRKRTDEADDDDFEEPPMDVDDFLNEESDDDDDLL